MTTGTWDPDAVATHASVEQKLLERMIQIIEQGHGEEIGSQLSDGEKTQHGIMRLPIASWTPHLEHLSEAQLHALIRFFTLVEMQLPDWHAGDRSPVIAINRVLRSRGHKLDTDTLKWIRSNSTNRFIPNGAVL